MSDRLSQIDVVVLAGGKGTRLAGVLSDRPKILAPIGDTPYIEFLLDWLQRSGFRRIVFCLGHLADPVDDWLSRHNRPDMSLISVRETEPAGTAGALRYAGDALRSDPVLVMNGDSFVDGDFKKFLTDYQVSRSSASIMCVAVPDASRYGSIEINAAGWIENFSEKRPDSARPGLINAGVYLFSRTFLRSFLERHAVSLEQDVFARSAAGSIRCFPVEGTFHDIGTPASLTAAAAVLAPYRMLGAAS